MDNLIYIWIANRLLASCYTLSGVCFVSSLISFLIYLFAAFGAVFDNNKEPFERIKTHVKKWLVFSIVATFFSGFLSAFTLDKVEFKTVAMYLIGKEIVQSDKGEKVINIIDNKLDEWIKKVEK